ncbi:MAG: HD domain-containing protein [Spirochaetaceae bacterium]|nr:MAG: HD domain-containing protein [Spirochaetaceae bacterium]
MNKSAAAPDPLASLFPKQTFIHAASAVQYYLVGKLPQQPFLLFNGDLSDLARCFDEVEYTAGADFDAIVTAGSQKFMVECRDDHSTGNGLPGSNRVPDFLNWLYSPHRKVFHDVGGIYSCLRDRSITGKITSPDHITHTLYAYAQLDLKFSNSLANSLLSTARQYMESHQSSPLENSPVSQRILLSQILDGKHSQRAIELLRKTGWIDSIWPELISMNTIGQGKAEHPEGNVWEHSLAALSFRKSYDLRLGLAVLLHDIGKPEARPEGGHRFHLHADIGAKIANRLLSRLGFPVNIIQDVTWLIKYHSIPGALTRLPTHRSGPLMEHPLFPWLLELYRCDLCATFRGPDNYYKACAVYRSFLKNNKNPFRSQDGKKLLRLLVE